MEPFMGQIQPFAFGFTPRGWQFCNGQLLPISQYNALYALLGTTFGGNGQTTFGLPDLRGRSIVHPGTGPGLSTIDWGEVGGVESLTLLQGNMPMHAHALVPGSLTASISVAESASASNVSDGGANLLGTGGDMPTIYREGTATDILGGVHVTLSGSTSVAGGSQPIALRNPFLGIYMSIAIEGYFPSRD